MAFSFTAKQEEAQAVLAGPARNILLYGGGRSGKTFVIIRAIVMRALKAPGSRHGIFRFRFNHLAASIIADTFPKVMKLCFPEVKYELNKSSWCVTYPNGSEIWFCGLDEAERTEKVLGMEFASLFFNEVSQIARSSIDIALTRLAQRVLMVIKNRAPQFLKLRAYFDCNPGSRAHWTYKTFIQKVDPETKQPLKHPEEYVALQLNPVDNKENLAPEYLKDLEDLPARTRKRFLHGEFADATPNALFPEETIDKWRVEAKDVPDLVRVVIAVDPSGAGDINNQDNDAIGIVAVGLGRDGNAYVLEDCTVKAGPATWGRVATDAFDRHRADLIVGETNYGGAMVEQTIRVARPRTPFKRVVSSRGKVLRAEPFSALYEKGKVRHVGTHVQLEDELAAFSTMGYTGDRSPNSADACVFALCELFPAMTGPSRPTLRTM